MKIIILIELLKKDIFKIKKEILIKGYIKYLKVIIKY